MPKYYTIKEVLMREEEGMSLAFRPYSSMLTSEFWEFQKRCQEINKAQKQEREKKRRQDMKRADKVLRNVCLVLLAGFGILLAVYILKYPDDPVIREMGVFCLQLFPALFILVFGVIVVGAFIIRTIKFFWRRWVKGEKVGFISFLNQGIEEYAKKAQRRE